MEVMLELSGMRTDWRQSREKADCAPNFNVRESLGKENPNMNGCEANGADMDGIGFENLPTLSIYKSASASSFTIQDCGPDGRFTIIIPKLALSTGLRIDQDVAVGQAVVHSF
jgi:hypothetical protein